MPMRTNAPSVASQTNEEQRMVSPTMEHMARSMTSMSEMCQRMMQKEMASRPLITAAAVILGTLGVVALALFVVLENPVDSLLERSHQNGTIEAY